jgi:hypothetical protein
MREKGKGPSDEISVPIPVTHTVSPAKTSSKKFVSMFAPFQHKSKLLSHVSTAQKEMDVPPVIQKRICGINLQFQ